MEVVWIIISFCFTVIAWTILLPGIMKTYLHFNNRLAITCPEKGMMAFIRISAGLAAASSVFLPTVVRVSDCSLSPHCKTCARSCAATLR